MKRSAGSLAALFALVAVGACTSGGDGGEPASTASKPAGTAAGMAGAAEQSSVPSGDNGDLKDPVGAIRELSDVTCVADSGAWSASAKLTNSGDIPSTYLVKFSVVKSKTSTVEGSALKTIELAAGKTAKVDLPAFYKGGAKGLSCVPRVVKGDAG